MNEDGLLVLRAPAASWKIWKIPAQCPVQILHIYYSICLLWQLFILRGHEGPWESDLPTTPTWQVAEPLEGESKLLTAQPA